MVTHPSTSRNVHPERSLRFAWSSRRGISLPQLGALYGLKTFSDAKEVMRLEGEKCVRTARAQLPLPVLTWPWTGNANIKGNSSPLAGWSIVLCRDVDAKPYQTRDREREMRTREE